jgi:pimeloyl-ACP methyl ester carboxylesterase
MEVSYEDLLTPWGAIGCRKMGRGPRLLIAWHGFGEDSRAFECLGKPLADSCTLYALDLPFHGQTQWQGATYRPKQLCHIVDMVLARAGKTRFEAVGHSLGGRLWICLLPQLASRMDALYLLAPDGLHTRAMGLAERLPLPLRQGLGCLAARPTTILPLLHRFGLIDDFADRYLRHQLGDDARRERLLHTWYSLARFPLGPAAARRRLAKGRVPTLVLLGQDDKLVPNTALRESLQGLDNVLLQEISADHRSICQEAAPFLNGGLLPYWNHFNVLLQRDRGR